MIWRLFICLSVTLLVSALLKTAQGQSLSDKGRFTETADRGPCLAIRRIVFSGNKRTKERAMLREMALRPQQVLCMDNWNELMEIDEQNIYNTGLFDTVTVSLQTLNSTHADIHVSVKERLYIYPVPIFNLSGNSLPYWWNTLNRDPKWITYGINFLHLNLSGLNDQLKLTTNFGANQQLNIEYLSPFFDPYGQYNMSGTLNALRTKQVVYGNCENVPVFRFGDQTLLTYLGGSVSANYRRLLTYQHTLSFSFESIHVDGLSAFNPNYLLGNARRRRALGLSYQYQLDTRDYTAYPRHGHFLESKLDRWGLGLFNEKSIWSSRTVWDQYYGLGERFFLAQEGLVRVSAPLERAYVDRLNFQDNVRSMRGYEGQLIQGPHYALSRSTLRYKLFELEWRWNTQKRVLDYVSYLPFRFYPYVFFDNAWVKSYADESGAPYNDTWLGATGVGMDLYTFYDLVIGSYYAWTIPHQQGVFAFYLYKR